MESDQELEEEAGEEVQKEEILQRRIRKTLIFLLLLFTVSFFIGIKFILFFVFIVFLNAQIEKYQAKVAMPTRIEIATTGTIIATLAYGPWWGIFTALFSRGVNTFVLKDFKREHFIMILTYVLAALMANFIPLDIGYLGILITIVTSLILYFVRIYILGLVQWRAISRTLSNIVFNVLFFMTGMAGIIVNFLLI